MAEQEETQEADGSATRIDSLRPIKAIIKSKGANKPAEETTAEKGRQEWARQMRLKFTPKDMITEEGAINDEYFKPKMSSFKIRKWTDVEKDALVEGIKKYGIGKWDVIQRDYLPDWEPAEIRVKTSRLVGRQSLVEYIQQNWKGDKEAITVEYNRNKAIGLKLKQWKGALINDEAGVVKHALETWPYPDGYSNPYMPSNAAHTTPVPQSFFSKSIVGQRVAVWFEDLKQYAKGIVTRCDDEKKVYRIKWDSGEEGEVELNPKDKTTNSNREERWCLEKELTPAALAATAASVATTTTSTVSTTPDQPSSPDQGTRLPSPTRQAPASPPRRTRRRWQTDDPKKRTKKVTPFHHISKMNPNSPGTEKAPETGDSTYQAHSAAGSPQGSAIHDMWPSLGSHLAIGGENIDILAEDMAEGADYWLDEDGMDVEEPKN